MRGGTLVPGDAGCGCCADGGYVVDGICVACGWGDLDHRLFMHPDWRLAPLSLLKDARKALFSEWVGNHMQRCSGGWPHVDREPCRYPLPAVVAILDGFIKDGDAWRDSSQ